MKIEKILVSEWKQVICKYREVKLLGCLVYRESLYKKKKSRKKDIVKNKYM